MKSVLFVLLSWVFANGLSNDHYVSSVHAITITPPVAVDAAQIPHQVAAFFLPTKDGFAPNLNILRQQWTGSLPEYIALSRQQFEQLGVDVLQQSVHDTEAYWEYTMQSGNNLLHCYAKAMLHKGGIYLATATDLDANWPSTKDTFIQSVNSFSPTQIAEATQE